MAGVLYIVATPIGNTADMTERAKAVLSSVAVVYCEDTRHSRSLLQMLGIDATLRSCHEHNEAARAQEIIEQLKLHDVALISDAGTPLISDPGYRVVSAVCDAGFRVSPIPGCCAAIAALSASGVASDKFQFIGFLPTKAGARKAVIEGLKRCELTTICYESVHRIEVTLQCISECLPERNVVMAKELTKLHEAVVAGCADDLLVWLQDDPKRRKGEFVLVFAPATDTAMLAGDINVDRLLGLLSQELPPKKAADIAAKVTGVAKKELYQRLVDK